MGISTDAHLGYGIVFSQEELDAQLTEEEFENEEETKLWEHDEELEKMGLKIFYFGHMSSKPNGMGICVKETYFTGDPYENTEIDMPEINMEWKVKLQKACELVGLPYRQPKWNLAVYYG